MKIAIIGGGVAGLAAAYDLSKSGHQVTLFETEPVVGGLSAGFKDENWDWTLEKFYHHWFYTDQDILALIDEIGQSDKVRFLSPTTSLWDESGIYPMDAPVMGSGLLGRVVNILRLKKISLLARLRLGAVGFALSKWPDGTGLEKYTANEWSARWVGQAAHDLIWRPMLIAKFGPLFEQVNMAWLWARLYKRTAKLGTYVGGFQAFLDDLAEAVREQGGDLRLGVRVTSIKPRPEGGYTVQVAGDNIEVDRVLSTTSPKVMSRLVPALPEDYRQQLEALVSIGAMVLVLALDRQLMRDGTYWLNLPARSPDKTENPFPFLALVEHTNFLNTDYYGGDHLVYLGDYLPADHAHFRMSDEELAALYLPALKRIAPDFSPEWIRKQWVFRAAYAQPVPLLNHSTQLPDLQTPLEGLVYASMSQVYPWDRGTNYAVEIGRRAARLLVNA